MPDRTCPCGASFKGLRRDARYCSERCRKNAGKRRARSRAGAFQGADVECAVCGVQFFARLPQARYCTRRCANKAARAAFNKAHPEVAAARARRQKRMAKVNQMRGEVDRPYDALTRDPCAYCGAAGGTIDHITPVIDGGSDDLENLTGACNRCNGRKRELPLLRFLLAQRIDGELQPLVAEKESVLNWRVGYPL